MEPVKMPDNWYDEFTGVRIAGRNFKVANQSLTNDITMIASFIIELASGLVTKDRTGRYGEINLGMRGLAKDWPILHDNEYGRNTYRRLHRHVGILNTYRSVYGGTN